MSAIMMVHNNNIRPVAAAAGGINLVVSSAPVVAQSPFVGGGNSYSFAGSTSSYVYYSGLGNSVAFGTGDYTIEWWQYDRGSSTFPRLFWYVTTPGGTLNLGMSQEGSAASRSCYLWSPTSTNLSSTQISINTWYHFAIVRISGRVYFYKNGTLLNAGGTVNTSNIGNTVSNWYIGSKAGGGLASEQFYGYITNFRVCKGVGVYTGNFTTPTTALQTTQDAGTNISAITAGQCAFLLQP